MPETVTESVLLVKTKLSPLSQLITEMAAEWVPA
jgi:hypothetical protein